MKNLVLTLHLMGLAASVCGQQLLDDSTDILATVIVSAGKFPEQQKQVAQRISVLHKRDIQTSFSNNTASLLEQSGKIFVQRSQLGGGSPVINGFEASRILLVVDGVRMNNAIYRTGHLQNAISIDDDILEKVEILYGPSSTVYGSDALGGVIHFQTKQPRLSPQGFRTTTNVAARYSSAFEEYSGHADLELSGKKLASLTSFSYSRFGNLRQGGNRNPFYGDFGKRTQYIARINSVDSIMTNNNCNVQIGSKYKQYDLLQKLRWEPVPGHAHSLNLQYSTTSDIPRYDRLTDTRNGRLRWAEWYYGPQQRWMAAYTYKAQQLHGFFDQFMVTASYQWMEESRMQRAYRNNTRENRIEKLDVLAFQADWCKQSGRHELSAGIDGQYNFLRSTAFNLDIVSGNKNNDLVTRYPDGNNSMHYTGLYAQHLFQIIPGKLILNDGIRWNYITLDAHFRDTAKLHLPFTGASQKNFTYSLNAGLIYFPAKPTRLAFHFATGFRAPNIDDLAKVFESAGGQQLVVPNPDLRPEKTYNFNLNVSHHFGNWISLEGNAFYTLFRDAIVLSPFQLNGLSGIMYDGQMTPVVANQNKARATIRGVYGAIEVRPIPAFSTFAHITYTYGRYKGSKGEEVPLDHIPPLFGKAGVTGKSRMVEGSCYVLFNAWKNIEDYNPYGEDNAPYATPLGMPAWTTLNVSLTWNIKKHWQLQTAMENITDQHYRTFASGISAPGRNLVIKLRAQFPGKENARQ